MCSAEAVTKEHAPPFSFFPKGFRHDLWTVPSCDEHNSSNSKDVEYCRNIIATHLHTERAMSNRLQDKVLRSFRNSPKLFNRTFADAKPIIINGRETGVYTLDLPRFKTVMEAIAYAMYYRLCGTTYLGAWDFFSPSLVSYRTLYQSLPDGWEQVRSLLSKIGYQEIRTPQPKIFRLGLNQVDEERLIYAFIFYNGFIVNCLGSHSLPDATRQATPDA